MRPSIAKLTLLLICCSASSAFAQEKKVIDVFDGQSEMKATSIRVESTDGSSADSDDGLDTVESGGLGGGFTLRFEKNGGTFLVPAKVQGRSVYFVFDTGATYTTLPMAFAKSVGIAPKKGYPALRFQTANGPSASKVGLIKSLDLGGHLHVGVTFSVCDNCPAGMYRGRPIVGLLGMNVIGRYRTSFDHSRGVIEMTPSSRYADRLDDIQPWLDGSAPPTISKDGNAILLPVKNLAPRKIKEITLRYSCAGGTPRESKQTLGAGETKKFRVRVKTGDCRKGFESNFVRGRW